MLSSIIGGALMSFLPQSNKSGILAGIYLVNAVVAPLTVFYNVSPYMAYAWMNGDVDNRFSGLRQTSAAQLSEHSLLLLCQARSQLAISSVPRHSKLEMPLIIAQLNLPSWAHRLDAHLPPSCCSYTTCGRTRRGLCVRRQRMPICHLRFGPA